MYDCKAPLSRFYYPDTRRIINAFIIIIIIITCPVLSTLTHDQPGQIFPRINEHHATEVAIINIVQDVVGQLNQQSLTRPFCLKPHCSSSSN